MKFFFFLFFLINLQQSLGKIFTFESSPKYYLPFISLSFSEKEGGQILPVNTQIQLSWLNYVDSKCRVSDIMNHAFVCSSTIFYDSKPLVDLPFHSYKDSIRVEDKKSGLSMAFKYNNDSYSLVNKLQNIKLINKKQFSFQFTQDNKGYFHIGGVPNMDKSLIKNKGLCKINETTLSWGCQLESIMFNNRNYSLNTYAYFQSSNENLIESKPFFDFMKEVVLVYEFQNKQCYVSNNDDWKFFIYCDLNIKKQFGDITLVFNGLNIKLSFSDLFMTSETKIISKFSYDHSTPLRFEFGYEFLKKFNLVTFDYDLGGIMLYSDKEIIVVNGKNINIFLYLFLFIDIICVLGLFGFVNYKRMIYFNNNIRYNNNVII